MKGTFTISLDFELHWGGFEKWDAEKYRTYFLNTRKAIPEMLKLFAGFDVHVTWATVGILFYDSIEQLNENIPDQKPSYRELQLSVYEYIRTHGIGTTEEVDPLHFARSLVKQIASTPNQEIGSHTFGHYYCNEEGQTVDQFFADLQAAQRSAQTIGRRLSALVFPRNQFNDEYLKACYDAGFRAVRSNPQDWFWNIQTRQETFWKRLNRGLDAYFPIGNKNTFPLSSLTVRKGFPVCIPASRLLRPYRPQEVILNTFKISRIKSEMTRAAKSGECYHLWWHPHNFGHFPVENLRDLKVILEHFAYCRDKYGMESCSMTEIAERLLHEPV